MRKIIYLLVLFFAFSLNAQQTNPNMSPWDYCQDGNPIGGGQGYDRIITSGNITITTSDTYATLKSKIEGALSGDVVFINSNVSMDLTNLGSSIIGIPAGVTVASDRGNGSSNGALLYSYQVKYLGSGSHVPIFRVDGEGVRITGFNMRGPYGFSGTYPTATTGYDVQRQKFCISSNYDNTEIDNMHGYNWPASFISLSRYGVPTTVFGPQRQVRNVKVHHNYIHNNLQNGLGYAVDTQNSASVEIYANMFHSNRHDIQNRGNPDCGYEAYCNTTISEFPANTGFTLNGSVGTKVYNITSDGSGNTISQNPLQAGNTHHNYDVHPEYYCDGDNWNYGLCYPPAGARYYIHHNDFQDDGVARHSPDGDMHNFGIGGIPAEYARAEYNRTLRPYLDNWEDDGSYTDKSGPYKDYFFAQGRVVPPIPNGNITLLGNVLNGATPSGQTGSQTGITDMYWTSTGTAQYVVNENITDPSATISIDTPETGESYTYELVPRDSYDDSGFFTVTGNTATMDNGSSYTPDYETPEDATNANNIYGFNMKVTSTSGATLTKDMAFRITDVVEGGDVPVTSLVFDRPNQTIMRWQQVDLSHTFNGGATTPDNTTVFYFSSDENKISDNGYGLESGEATLVVVSEDDPSVTGTITVNVNGGTNSSKRKLMKIKM